MKSIGFTGTRQGMTAQQMDKMEEEQKTGTWYTIRYARKQNKQIVIFWPDGTITNE